MQINPNLFQGPKPPAPPPPSAGWMDSQTMAQITMLFLSIFTLLFIIVLWLLVRRCRGDKQSISSGGSNEHSEIGFDDDVYKGSRGISDVGNVAKSISRKIEYKNPSQ